VEIRLAKVLPVKNRHNAINMSNACESFLTKWSEFNENTEMDPTDIVWSEFLRSDNYGLLRVERNYGAANSAQQLAANMNKFFAEDNYPEELTPEEADFVWNLYQRKNIQVPDDILITCNVLNTIVTTPADQVGTINWDMFDAVPSGSEDEDEEDRPFGSDEGDEGFNGRQNQPARTPFPAPSGQFQNVGFQAAPAFPQIQPATPAITFNPGATNPLAPAPSVTTPLAAPPTAVALQQPRTPGGLLNGGGFQAGLQPQTTTSQVASTPEPAIGHDLPYVTTVVKGLKPAGTSRLLLLQVDDDGSGNSLQIAVFITAGAVPATAINTTFSTDDYDFRDKAQKSHIHEQNKRVITAAPGLIPYNLSNGVDDKGVCAQIINGYKLNSVGSTKQNCPEGANRPKAVKMPNQSSTGISQPTSGGRTVFGQPVDMPTQPGLGQVPAGQVMFGAQPPSGGFTTPPTSGGSGLGLTVAPQGTRAITVPDFDKPGQFREAYQIPGGPHPIAVGKKVGQKPGTWYWYQLPNGSVVKSEQKYLGLLDKGITTKHGEKQLKRVEEILQAMRGNYGANFNQVNGAPVATGAVPQKSSGRGKAATSGKGKAAPAIGGFVSTQSQLPAGFGPAAGFSQQSTGFQTTPVANVFRVQATAIPPVQTGFQPSTGFQAALPPPIGSTPGLLQAPLPNFQAPPAAFGAQAPQPSGLFGGFQPTLAQRADALATPLQPPAAQQMNQGQQATNQQVGGNQRPEDNPLFALLQNQSQTNTIPTGLFGATSPRR
jgi:hypothetical protein